MTDADLARLESLANAATPGPWEYHYVPGCDNPHTVFGPKNEEQTMRFIAAARTALPALIAEVRRLRAAAKAGEMIIGQLLAGDRPAKEDRAIVEAIREIWPSPSKQKRRRLNDP